MSKPGPKPKPTHLKILEGNPGKRPLNKNEPKPKPVAPRMPTWLSNEAKQEWRKLAPELEKLGLLSVIDGISLAILCQETANYRVAVTDYKKALFLGKGNQKRKHPALQVGRDAATLIKSFIGEFGLSPSARTRLDIPGADDDDESDFD